MCSVTNLYAITSMLAHFSFYLRNMEKRDNFNIAALEDTRYLIIF